jgi:mannose-6-phosphate isomerase-like protein (cupin superfamily)/heme-degrading monooxygenase HmoA
MIMRYWRGWANVDSASAYLDHLRQETLPRLRAIDGHRDAYVLRRDTGNDVEFVVLTSWDSLDSVRRFAGDGYEAAVVPPEARRTLTSFDERVLHYDVAIGPASRPLRGRMAADYDIKLDDKYGKLAVIDIAAEAATHEPWFNQTLTSVNESVVRLGVIEGDFHWHKHDEEDEFFLVLEGELVIEVEGSDTVRLHPHQGFTVPKGVRHKTSAPERTVIVMVESAGVVPTGD